MKENGDLPEKQEVMPVERDAISNEEITSALAKRCSVSMKNGVHSRILVLSVLYRMNFQMLLTGEVIWKTSLSTKSKRRLCGCHA